MNTQHFRFPVIAIAFAISLATILLPADAIAEPEANNAEGVKSYDAGRYREAIDHFNRHLGVHPGCSVALGNIGRCHYKLGDYEEAARNFTSALSNGEYSEISGEDPTVQSGYDHSWRGDSYYALEQYQAAADDFAEAVRILPKRARDHYYRGYSLLFAGQYQAAVEAFSQALEHGYSDSSSAVAGRGRAYFHLGEFERALEHYEQAALLKPISIEPYVCRTLLLMAVGRPELAAQEAEIDCDRDGVLDVTSQYMAIYGYLAYRQAGKHNDADAFLERVAGAPGRTTWPYPIIMYLRGLITARALQDMATDNGKMTEVQTVFGLQAKVDRGFREAAPRLTWVVQSGKRTFFEWDLARVELVRAPFVGLLPSAPESNESGEVSKLAKPADVGIRNYHPIAQRPYEGKAFELGAPPRPAPEIDPPPLLSP